MKKDYNRDVMSDMPVDSSFTPPVKTTKSTATKPSKPKINAIGTQKRTGKAATTKISTGKYKTSSSKSKVEVGGSNKELRTKLTNSEKDLTDLEKLNEENIKTFRFKSKRNKVFIAILSVLLVISIVSIVTFLLISKLKTNCNMYIHGDVDATFIIDGMELDEFRSPSNLQGNRIFEFKVEIRIDSRSDYNIKYTANAYQKGVLMNNTLIYENNVELFYEGEDGFYRSIDKVQGGQTITLCGGVILDYDYEQSLNVDNFKLDFHVYFEKA